MTKSDIEFSIRQKLATYPIGELYEILTGKPGKDVESVTNIPMVMTHQRTWPLFRISGDVIVYRDMTIFVDEGKMQGLFCSPFVKKDDLFDLHRHLRTYDEYRQYVSELREEFSRKFPEGTVLNTRWGFLIVRWELDMTALNPMDWKFPVEQFVYDTIQIHRKNEEFLYMDIENGLIISCLEEMKSVISNTLKKKIDEHDRETACRMKTQAVIRKNFTDLLDEVNNL